MKAKAPAGQKQDDGHAARLKVLEVAVRNGTYRPDAGLIAARLLADRSFTLAAPLPWSARAAAG